MTRRPRRGYRPENFSGLDEDTGTEIKAILELCIEFLQRFRDRDFHILPNVPARPTPEDDLMNKELGTAIADALTTLPPRQRIVFTLKHYEGRKLKEIADMIGCSENAAKNALFRATQKLRKFLAEYRE